MSVRCFDKGTVVYYVDYAVLDSWDYPPIVREGKVFARRQNGRWGVHWKSILGRTPQDFWWTTNEGPPSHLHLSSDAALHHAIGCVDWTAEYTWSTLAALRALLSKDAHTEADDERLEVLE